jgi:hypothetical protein
VGKGGCHGLTAAAESCRRNFLRMVFKNLLSGWDVGLLRPMTTVTPSRVVCAMGTYIVCCKLSAGSWMKFPLALRFSVELLTRDVLLRWERRASLRA